MVVTGGCGLWLLLVGVAYGYYRWVWHVVITGGCGPTTVSVKT